MKLIHPQITWEEIPKQQDVIMHPVESNYRKVLMAEWAIFWLIVLTVAVACAYFIDALHSSNILLLIGTGYVLLAVFHYISIRKAFPLLAYAVREHDVLLRKGWLFRQIHVVPINRIQHCVIKKGPLERRYQLASLQLFTAATSFTDIKIGGLTEEQAERLKEWVLAKQVVHEQH